MSSFPLRAFLVTAALLFAIDALAGDRVIPVAAHVAGLNGTFFRTDVRIVNLASASATVEVTWLPSNRDNSSPQHFDVTIPARASRQLDDIVLGTFGVSDGGGAIRLTSSSDFVATSRTYTTSSAAGCAGTFGQFIPALDVTEARTRNVVANVQLSDTTTSGFRTNVGLVNLTSQSAAVTLRLRSADGAQLASSQLSVLPGSHTQVSVNGLFGVTRRDDNLFIETESAVPVIAYASVVDNASADPVFIAAAADTGTAAPVAPLITARQWAFDPPTIEAVVGKEMTVIIRAIDVDHGVGFSGVGPFSCSSDQGGQCVLRPNEDVTIKFTPTSAGTFAFFCTRFCGSSNTGTTSHETMRGSVVVR